MIRRLQTAASLWLRCVAIAGLAAAQILAYAPFGYGVVAWFSLALSYVLLSQASSGRQACALGFAYGLGLFGAGVNWLYISLVDVNGLPAALGVALTALFVVYLALYPALTALMFVRLGLASWPGRALAFASCWSLAEMARGSWLTGFPWLSLGYSQIDTPLVGLAPILGVYGCGWAAALVAACLGDWLIKRRRWQSGLVIVGLLALGVLLGQMTWSEPQGAGKRVALLQGNLEQRLKWRPGALVEAMSVYLALIEAHPAEITVLPETALPIFYQQLPSDWLDQLSQLAARQQGDIVLGLPYGSSRRYWNSVVSLGASPAIVYSKRHLVPFGEFMPLGLDQLARLLAIPMSDFSAGQASEALSLQGLALGFTICYEDVFGHELRTSLPQAGVLINVSNTAWFGRSLAQAQHLEIARMRARELARPMLRATNTGMTAAIDEMGRVTAQLPPFTSGALVTEVVAHIGLTPYARFGDWLMAGLIGVWALGLWWVGQRR